MLTITGWRSFLENHSFENKSRATERSSNDQVAITSVFRSTPPMTSTNQNDQSASPNEVSTSSSRLGDSTSSSKSRISSASPRERKRSNEGKESADRSSMRSLQTPLSFVKVRPLSFALNHHNKVGSSFLGDQQNVYLANGGGNDSATAAALASNQEAAMLAVAAAGSLNGKLPVRVRRVRDSGALLFMLAFLGFLGYIIWDGLFIKETDVNLIVHGHDSYGNICGRNNRPIKYADKSGQNYTDRPYTKYTLINSQFERYTLDSGRLKNGELVYVKEIPDSEFERRQGNHFYDLPSLQHWPPLAATPMSTTTAAAAAASTTSKRQMATTASRLQSTSTPREPGSRVVFSTGLLGDKMNGANSEPQRQFQLQTKPIESNRGANKSSTRSRRQTTGATQAVPNILVELTRAQKSNNYTLSKAIKSSLMYQYPPMYGYSSELTTPAYAHSITSKTTTTSSTTATRLNLGSGGVPSISKHEIDPKEVHESGPSVSFLQQQQQNFKHQSLNNQSFDRNQGATFKSNNDTGIDRFDHMLVTPISVMTNSYESRRPGASFTSSAEFPNHLLYLTECVASCPRDHIELIFYRCMPNTWRFSLFPNAINVTRTFIDEILTDISHCYRELIYTFSLALVLSLGLLILLRFLASIIIWSCILVLISLFLSMASYSWLTFYYQILDLNNVMPHDPIYNEKLATSDKWLIGSIFLTFVAFASIGAIIFMRKRILLVTMLFRESGKAIADMPLLLLQPLLTFGALIGIMVVWSLGLICLQSMKKPVIDVSTGFVVFQAETLYRIMKWYHIFAFLWVSHFAIACQHYVIGASVSKWYFSSNRYELSSPIGNSISELILYYMGSVALGSFLVAIFKVIRIVTRQIQFLVQRNCISPSSGNSPSSAQLMDNNALAIPQATSASCCGSFAYIWRLSLWFIDNVVMIINRDAYVEIAIHGHSFVAGARRAFTVLASNPLRLLAIKSVGNLLLIIAKICVVFGTASVAYVLLEEKKQTLNYSWSPIVVSAIYAYIVAHWFLSVYEMVIDALFICYCEDYEMTKNQEELVRQIRGSNFMSHILNTNLANQAVH